MVSVSVFLLLQLHSSLTCISIVNYYSAPNTNPGRTSCLA
jgi:hypothetical protein